MTTLIRCAYRGQMDGFTITHLVNACEAVDHLGEEASATELLFRLDSPSVDRHRDIRLWEDENGHLVALAHVHFLELSHGIDGYIWYYVHPQMRSHGLEIDALNWCEKRISEIKEAYGKPVKLRLYRPANHIQQTQLLKQQNFTIDRYFFTMMRSLHQPMLFPKFSADFKLSSLQEIPNIQTWIEMYNDSFMDHWNHHELTMETMQYWMSHPNYQLDFNLIALAPDNTFAAFCSCQIKPEHPATSRPKTGWIEWLGTRRRFRKMGLGRAMLLAGLHRLKAAGMDAAQLSVDADSLTDATRLYESVGFQTVQTWYSWVKTV